MASIVRLLKRGRSTGPDGFFKALFNLGGEALKRVLNFLIHKILNEQRAPLLLGGLLIVLIFKR